MYKILISDRISNPISGESRTWIELYCGEFVDTNARYMELMDSKEYLHHELILVMVTKYSPYWSND